MNRNVACHKNCCKNSENQFQPTNAVGLRRIFGQYPDEPIATGFDRILNYFGIKCDGETDCVGLDPKCRTKSICCDETKSNCCPKKCSRFAIRNCCQINETACGCGACDACTCDACGVCPCECECEPEICRPCKKDKCSKNECISLFRCRSNNTVHSHYSNCCSQSYTKLFEVLGPPPEIVETEWALTRINLFSDASKTYEVMDDENNAVHDIVQHVKQCRTKTFFAVLPDGSTASYDSVSNSRLW